MFVIVLQIAAPCYGLEGPDPQESVESYTLDNEYNLGHTIGMKTAISIPDKLFKAAEDLARRLGISRSLLYQRAIEHYLAAQGHDVIRESLDAVYSDERVESRLDPAIEFLQNTAIEGDDW